MQFSELVRGYLILFFKCMYKVGTVTKTRFLTYICKVVIGKKKHVLSLAQSQK